jgi:hypothetical protein
LPTLNLKTAVTQLANADLKKICVNLWLPRFSSRSSLRAYLPSGKRKKGHKKGHPLGRWSTEKNVVHSDFYFGSHCGA